jgi:hypothetical protein
MPKRSGKPAHRLKTRLSETRRHSTTRKLERLGAAGLIPSQTKGREDEVADQAAEALDLFDETGSYHRAVLAMVGRGQFRVERDKIEQAYARWVSGSRRWITSRGSGLAASLARQGSKRSDHAALRDRLKPLREARFMSVPELLASFYEDLILIVDRGAASSDHAFRELMEGLGVGPAVRERVGTEQPLGGDLPMQALKTVLKRLQLESLLAAVRHARDEDLELARDDARAFIDFARAATPLLSRTYGLHYSLGFALLADVSDTAVALTTPALMALRTALPAQMSRMRKTIDQALPGYRAMNHLLDDLPRRYHTVFADEARVRALPPDDFEEVRREVRRFQRAHADEFDSILAFDSSVTVTR